MHDTGTDAGDAGDAPDFERADTGPPRFTTVGDTVELAPRDPDPEAAYEWEVVRRPDGSSASVAADPVVRFAPDVPGTYRLRLSVGNGDSARDHQQTVRAFPNERRPVRFELSVSDLPISVNALERISVAGPANDWLVGRDRPTREGGSFVFETELPPGDHELAFLPDDDLTEGVRRSATAPGPGRPRVRLDARVEREEVVVTANPAGAPDSDRDDADLDVEFYLDDRDEFAGDAVHEDRVLRLPLDALGERLRVHAVAVGERHSVADCVDLRESDSGEESAIEVRRPNDPPEWAESATVYEIFVRSFAGETVETTFEELERRVPYLQSLSVDCVWLTPILGSPTDHGYHTTDYFDTASDLGTREEFESFVAACHDAGIRVVFDLVVNHSSRDHPAFQQSASGVEGYEDWYVWEDADELADTVPAGGTRETRETREPTGERVSESERGGTTPEAREPRTQTAQCYFNWTRIPNFNFRSLSVRRFLLDVVGEWADLVDGFRCDVAWGVPHGFWKEVADATPDDFLLLDETIPRDPQYHEGEFTMHYDTTLYGTLREIGTGEEPATAIFDALADAERTGFPDDAVHLRYVENHDEDRYLDECNRAALKAAAAATFTLPGAPMIYYGQERGMTEYRGTMNWYDADELLPYHRNLSRARDEHAVLREGSVGRVEWECEDAAEDVVAFTRESDDGDALVAVVLNFGEGTRDVTLDASVAESDLLTGDSVEVARDGGTSTVSVLSALVLEIED